MFGGTFTDLVYFETDQKTGVQTVKTEKSDTTPPDFEKGVLNVLEKGQCRYHGSGLLCPRNDRCHQTP
ncbi:hydantoinase/oxoprolinase N-terminal domain-containing protein [uncultured Cohaesibacter sp.]|uniref:hydantoinase/oxoprolinase N-terminal domain-containing protein n=1 Tax=uncultured Cohaesibacter sp. TaxID=1002546 RepID=UPI0029C83A76|nr:hydantoinase/oxoprolinase N-terminal domain-containing protein [uncultured Cohaesibacter sp.]